MVGLSDSDSDVVTVGCTVTTAAGLVVITIVDDVCWTDPLETLTGWSVPNASIVWPGTT